MTSPRQIFLLLFFLVLLSPTAFSQTDVCSLLSEKPIDPDTRVEPVRPSPSFPAEPLLVSRVVVPIMYWEQQNPTPAMAG